MLILHAAWLPASAAEPAGLALWGETDEPTAHAKARGRRARAAPASHPFCAAPKALQWALAVLKITGRPAALVARLPSAAGAPQPSRAFLREREKPGTLTLAAWQISALMFAPNEALDLLINLPETAGAGLALGADAAFWVTPARFVFELLAGQRYLPALVEEGADGGCRAVWRPVLDG